MLRIKCPPLYFTASVLLILRIKSSELNGHRRDRIFLLRIEPKHRPTKLEIHLLPDHEPVKIEEPRKIEEDKLNKGAGIDRRFEHSATNFRNLEACRATNFFHSWSAYC